MDRDWFDVDCQLQDKPKNRSEGCPWDGINKSLDGLRDTVKEVYQQRHTRRTQMKYNLGITVKSLEGTNYKNAKGEDDTMLNICKVVVSQPLQDDPKNIEHMNKSLRIYQKLEASENGEVEFKKESMVFMRDRMLKMGLPNLVVFAFNNIFEEAPTAAQLDDV